MRARVEIPDRDAPRAWSLALVAALALFAGSGLSFWASSSAHEEASRGVEAAEPASPPERGAAESERADVAVAEPSEAEPIGDEAPPEPSEEVRPAPPVLGLRIARGRIAYLRCEGVRRRRGPFPCPRDEAMERAVWPVIEGLLGCAAGPRSAGEADLRIEYAGQGAPAIAWRDTFASDVNRLDSEAVLGCLRGPLERTRQGLGAEQLVVSFRFSVVSAQ